MYLLPNLDMASLDIHSITSVHCEKYLLFIFCSQLAHAIRMMLHYKEAEFEDKMYTQGDAPDFSREEWRKEKFTLGLDLPNESSFYCSMLRFPITQIMCK